MKQIIQEIWGIYISKPMCIDGKHIYKLITESLSIDGEVDVMFTQHNILETINIKEVKNKI